MPKTMINMFDLIILLFSPSYKWISSSLRRKSGWNKVWPDSFGVRPSVIHRLWTSWEANESSISYLWKISRRALHFSCLFPGMILTSSDLRIFWSTELNRRNVSTCTLMNIMKKTLPQTFTIPLCFPVQQLRLLPKQTRDRVRFRYDAP